jgi:hypothetical protein
MHLYNQYENDEREYLKYLEEMEEESINFEQMMRQKEFE